jgi:hypothetical protein
MTIIPVDTATIDPIITCIEVAILFIRFST